MLGVLKYSILSVKSSQRLEELGDRWLQQCSLRAYSFLSSVSGVLGDQGFQKFHAGIFLFVI
jgi:hypothetical protein